tara:strand:- start:295 stop:492 length:198 start_codon:yes stop_codon:yes gene_type:complete
MKTNEHKQDILKHLLLLLESDKFKDNFIDELNEAVDIPIFNEKKEGKIFKSLYNVLIKVVKNNTS